MQIGRVPQSLAQTHQQCVSLSKVARFQHSFISAKKAKHKLGTGLVLVMDRSPARPGALSHLFFNGFYHTLQNVKKGLKNKKRMK